MTPAPQLLPDDVAALRAVLAQERAALAAEQLARREAEARASGAEAMVAHLKLLIAKLRHERFGASAERGRKLLDQLELQLEELEAAASEDELAAEAATGQEGVAPRRPARRKPVRGPLPAHLPRERVVVPAPSTCPCCGGKLAKLGEDVTETLEVVPRRWKVVQTVRERFACRACESVTQPPAPFHPIARGRAGPELLAMILEAKFGQHLPLNRQSESYAREVAVVAALTHIRSRPWLEQMVARATRVDPHAGPYEGPRARKQGTLPLWLQEQLEHAREERGIVPLESNALTLRLVRLAPGPDLALARPEIEAQGDMLEAPSIVERRLRARVGEMVAAQVVEDGGEMQVRLGAGGKGHGLYHRYNAALKRVLGGKGRAAMSLPELEAAVSWLERNRLSDHLHLLDGDVRYTWTVRQRRGEWVPPVGRDRRSTDAAAAGRAE